MKLSIKILLICVCITKTFAQDIIFGDPDEYEEEEVPEIKVNKDSLDDGDIGVRVGLIANQLGVDPLGLGGGNGFIGGGGSNTGGNTGGQFIGGGGSNTGGNPTDNSGEFWHELNCPNSFKPSQSGKTCGTRSFRKLQGVSAGLASPDEFPWTCVVISGENDFIGTCVIVPDNSNNGISKGTTKVVTAAHKLETIGQFDEVRVRVGDYDLSKQNPSEIRPHEEYVVYKITMHPDYKKGRLLNDIAVLNTEKPMSLTAHNGVNAACLPQCERQFDFQFLNGTGARCWVAGWGKDDLSGSLQPLMKKVDITLFPDQRKCNRILKAEFERRNPRSRFNLHPSEMCAGGELGKDTCGGDGGAPLVCQDDSGRWNVVGLVAWGIGCGNQVPGVYVNVGHFLDWIHQSN